MNRSLKILALGVLLSLPWIGAVSAQQSNIYWQSGGAGFSGWQPLSASNPMPVSATITPSGTQNVNITQLAGAAPSLTNPLWVIPATGASFAVTGTFFQATQPVSGTVTSNTGGNSYTHITTAATTVIKSGAGVLHTVCVNALGTVASAVTVDDAVSATTPTIAVINSLLLSGCQTYDVAFSTGLTLVTTGTIAPDITVSWR